MQDNTKKDAYKELVKIVDRLFELKLKNELGSIVSKLVKEELSKYIDLDTLTTKNKIKESTESLIDNIVSTYKKTEGKQQTIAEETVRSQLKNAYESIVAETQQGMVSLSNMLEPDQPYQQYQPSSYTGIDIEPPVQMFRDPRLDDIIGRASKVYSKVRSKNK